MWRLVVVVVLGCNQVYGLDQTRQRDASMLTDGDNDGVADLEDNCPAIPNADQGDSDADRRGDRCDDCPLVANEQDLDFDNDRLGDVCDPHPALAGDCVLFVDTFTDPAIFETHWKVSAPSADMVIAEPGQIRLRPDPNQATVTLVALDVDGATDVILQGKTDAPTAIVSAIVAYQATIQPYACRLIAPSDFTADGPGIGLGILTPLVPSTPINNKFVVRLITFDTKAPDEPIDVLCRVDYGVSVGTNARPSQPRLVGVPAIQASVAASTLDAIVVSRFQPGTACPATQYR